MYTPTAYFFSRTLSGLIVQFSHPVLMTLIMFFGLGAPITGEQFFNFLGAAMQMAMVGCSVGYMCGVMTDDSNHASMGSMFIVLIFMLVSGGLNSAANYPVVID
jgi:ABC-2 type transporter